MEDKYCECCGRPTARIRYYLERLPFISSTSQREWKGHTQWKGQLHFHEYNTCTHCGDCGKELPDEAFSTCNEYRGECHGAPAYEQVCYGYRCPNCQNEVKF